MGETAYDIAVTSPRTQPYKRTKSAPTPLTHIKVRKKTTHHHQKVDSRTRFHIDISPLHPEHIRTKCEQANRKADGATPPNNGRTDQVVLGHHIGPTAHAQAEPHERPIPRSGRENVLFVWVRNKGVIRCHHGDVQVPKVTKERRAIQLHLTRRHCRDDARAG
jgi:hypothetical protein